MNLSRNVIFRIVFILLTFCALGWYIFTDLEKSQTTQINNFRKAQEIADIGLQKAYSHLAERLNQGKKIDTTIISILKEHEQLHILFKSTPKDSFTEIAVTTKGIFHKTEASQTKRVHVKFTTKDNERVWQFIQP